MKSVRQDYMKVIETFYNTEFEFNSDTKNIYYDSNKRMDLVDIAHVLPLVCFIVDMVFNKIIFPKRHIIGLLILVAMTKGLSVVSTNVLTHSLPGEYNLPVARASYPTYPSNMNLDCSTDWSIIVKVN